MDTTFIQIEDLFTCNFTKKDFTFSMLTTKTNTRKINTHIWPWSLEKVFHSECMDIKIQS